MTDLSHYTFGPSRRPSSSFLSSSSSSPAHSPLTITSNGGRRHSAGGPVHTTSHTRTNHISTAPSTRRNSASSTSSSSSSSPSTQDRANLRQRRRSSAHSLRERRRRYELTVVQQPQRGLALGSSINTLNRVPLSPIPVVQLTAREEGGERPPSPSETRYLFCSCALVPPDTELGGTVDYVAGGEGQTALVGQLVSSVKHVVALNGQPVAYFVFGDVSVRATGEWRLQFAAFEAQPGSPQMATTTSDTFEVFDRLRYTGPHPSEFATELTRHLHAQDVPVYVHPLDSSVLSAEHYAS